MIFLVWNKHRDANIFIDKDGVKLIREILEGYEKLEGDDHDHIQFSDGLISQNIIDGYEFDENMMANEITFRFRKNVSLNRRDDGEN